MSPLCFDAAGRCVALLVVAPDGRRFAAVVDRVQPSRLLLLDLQDKKSVYALQVGPGRCRGSAARRVWRGCRGWARLPRRRAAPHASRAARAHPPNHAPAHPPAALSLPLFSPSRRRAWTA